MPSTVKLPLIITFPALSPKGEGSIIKSAGPFSVDLHSTTPSKVELPVTVMPKLPSVAPSSVKPPLIVTFPLGPPEMPIPDGLIIKFCSPCKPPIILQPPLSVEDPTTQRSFLQLTAPPQVTAPVTNNCLSIETCELNNVKPSNLLSQTVEDT